MFNFLTDLLLSTFDKAGKMKAIYFISILVAFFMMGFGAHAEAGIVLGADIGIGGKKRG